LRFPDLRHPAAATLRPRSGTARGRARILRRSNVAGAFASRPVHTMPGMPGLLPARSGPAGAAHSTFPVSLPGGAGAPPRARGVRAAGSSELSGGRRRVGLL